MARTSMAIDQEEGVPLVFATAIQDHLDLRRRNATLEQEMPLQKYMPADPFENHPLFKTEEQARVEDTMDGVPSIVDEPTSLDWPLNEDTFSDSPAPETEPVSGDHWARSRDFDWGD